VREEGEYSWDMTIEVPDQIGGVVLSEAEAKLDLAIGLYTGRHASMGKAAKVADIPYIQFMRELGKRKICINYDVEDFEHDLQSIKLMEEKAKANGGHQ
jgi:predicted HTH domain antitoxin